MADRERITDAMRLDWLEENTQFTLRKYKKHWSCAKVTNYEYNTYATMREAIDPAMTGAWQA